MLRSLLDVKQDSDDETVVLATVLGNVRTPAEVSSDPPTQNAKERM